MIENKKKFIENTRVYLRAFNADDFHTTHKWRSDDEITSSLVGRKFFVSQEYEKKWINDSIFSSQNNIKLAVCLKNSNEHIGNVYLNSVDQFNQNAKLGILIGEKNYWSKGIGYEAAMSILIYAFYECNLKRVYSYQLIDNLASINLHKKCGFKNEGILRQAVFKNGIFTDLNVMGILRQEFDEILKAKVELAY